QLPMGTNNNFLTVSNLAYSQATGQLEPLPGSFENNLGFHVPRWWLSLNTRLRFLLVDTTPGVNRILDYVNLATWENPIDIVTNLIGGPPVVETSPMPYTMD